MIYKVKRFSRADYEGLDIIGKLKTRKLRNQQAKDLKQYRSLNNKIMAGMDSHRITAHDLAQDAAQKTRKIASQKIREGSEKRENLAQCDQYGQRSEVYDCSPGYRKFLAGRNVG